MTKKHFIQLAKAIATITDDKERERMAKLIGGVCADANQYFNWSTWFAACRVEQ